MVLTTIDYALSTVEAVTNVVYIPVAVALGYAIIQSTAIHVNLRLFVFIVNLQYCINSLIRIKEFIEDLIGGVPGGFREITYAWVYTIICNTFLWFGITIDRLVAVYYSDCYEAFFKPVKVSVTIFSIVGVLSAVLTYVSSVIYTNISTFLNHFSMIQLGFLIVNIIGLLFIFLHCNKCYSMRHESRLALEEKCRLKDDIRFTKAALPVAVWQTVLISVLLVTRHCVSYSYGVGFESLPQSYRYMSSMSQSFYRLGFAVWLLFSNQKFKKYYAPVKNQFHSMSRAKVTDVYQNYYNQQWNKT